MTIGVRLRQVRESKKLTQGDIQTRTGLLRCYISRVENGHTVPAISTLEKLACAMEIPLYQLFYDGDAPQLLKLTKSNGNSKNHLMRRGSRSVKEIARLYKRISLQKDRQLLMGMARRLADDLNC